MNDRLSALRLFSRVARLGSFSRAAREANLSQPSVSRIVAALEREIGASLLTRTTRAVVLTDAGRDYLLRIDGVLDALDEADHAVRGTGELRGSLRVGASSSMASRVVIPALQDFLKDNPNLCVELVVDDARQDLVTEAVDVALRFGKLEDSSAIARRIGINPRVLVAAPSYLQQAGHPASPADLTSHRIILGPVQSTNSAWRLERAGREVSVSLAGHISTNSNEAGINAAMAGLGIYATGRIGCEAELRAGQLLSVLPDWNLGGVELHAVFPAGRAAKPAARAFAERLHREFEIILGH